MDEEFVAPLIEGVKNMPENWTSAVSAVTSGATSAMSFVTGDVLLLALSFGFLFSRKAVSLIKRFIHIGGR